MPEPQAMPSTIANDVFESLLDTTRVVEILGDAKFRLSEEAYFGVSPKVQSAVDLAEAQMTACVALLKEMMARMKRYSA